MVVVNLAVLLAVGLVRRHDSDDGLHDTQPNPHFLLQLVSNNVILECS